VTLYFISSKFNICQTKGVIQLSIISLLDNKKNIHFVGIGGSGMYPLAQILSAKGYNITGSDIYASETLKLVKELNIPVFMGHRKENINSAELIVYSAAIKSDNPEIISANNNKIPVISRASLLGLVARKYSNCVAVSGTHGKTTTTAMVTQILLESENDITSIIGGRFPLIGGNSRVGNSETIVCEACEYVDSFLQIKPNISIILNIDSDHLDYFKNLENIKKSFHQFANQTKKILIANGDDPNVRGILLPMDFEAKVFTFGLSNLNDYYVIPKELNGAEKIFELMFGNERVTEIKLKVPGIHNLYNSIAAAAVAHQMGVSSTKIEKALSDFSGVHRRFEVLYDNAEIKLIDDFAHHPTEIEATLLAAKNLNPKRLWAIFEPHTYSRTFNHLDDFAKALSIADKVVLSEILAVREINIYNIFSKDLSDKIEECVWFKNFDLIKDYVMKNVKKGDLIVTLGGGNIYQCASAICQELKKL
jgi:UDP-N-acetylmuramate--alanine ligase